MNSMGKTLVLFTKGFPYNISEPFLENEYPLYKEYFDRVLIVTGCKKGEKPTRDIQDQVIHILDDYTLAKNKKAILESLPYVITDGMFYRELWRLIKEKKFSLQRFYRLLVMSVCGNHRALLAKRWIDSIGVWNDIDVIYSYWLDIPAYAALRLANMRKNKRIKMVSRCHGFDIFSERYNTGYLPCIEYLLLKMDYVLAASNAAKDYLQKKYAEVQHIGVSYVGCKDQTGENPYVARNILRVVSCSRVVPGKRVDRIVDALSKMKNRDILWTHIGGGEHLEDLVKYAREKLPPNVTAEFKGTIANEAVYQIYRSQPFHLFISTSQSEGGTPVSICEAASFHIPVLGTSVGGIPEFVENGMNGLLISKDFSDDDLMAAIEEIARMPEDAYQRMRCAARETYQKSFDACRNNRVFIESYLL